MRSTLEIILVVINWRAVMLDSEKWIHSPMSVIDLEIDESAFVTTSSMNNGGIHFEITYKRDVFDGEYTDTCTFNLIPQSFERTKDGRYKVAKDKFRLELHRTKTGYSVRPEIQNTKSITDQLFCRCIRLTCFSVMKVYKDYPDPVYGISQKNIEPSISHGGIEYLCDGMAKLRSRWSGDCMTLRFKYP